MSKDKSMEEMGKAFAKTFQGVHKVSGPETSDGIRKPNVTSVTNINKERTTGIPEEKQMYIIEEYNINGTKYSIQYTQETKAKDIFDCLNRAIVNKIGKVTYKDITILIKTELMNFDTIKIETRKGLGSWFRQ